VEEGGEEDEDEGPDIDQLDNAFLKCGPEKKRKKSTVYLSQNKKGEEGKSHRKTLR